MSGYSVFAQYYDVLTSNIDYKVHAEYYNKIIDKYYGKKGILLDLACGTGSLSEQMARLSYDVIGVDISNEMLSKALDKKFDSNLPIQYLCQDMCKLDMYGTIDITICALDSLNHLSDINKVKRAFERVSLFAEPGGLFIFDMNTPYKHKNVLGDNIFIYDTEDVYCVWENSYNKTDNAMDISLTFFENENGCYHRYEESFQEKAYETDAIKSILEKSGFELIKMYDYLTFDDVHEKSEKITYVARKVN